MNVGSRRDDERSSSEEDSEEEMVADVQERKHVEPSTVAGEEPDRDHEDLHEDEEAPARNVRNPKDPPPEQKEFFYKRGHLPYRGLVPSVREGQRQGGPAQGKGVRCASSGQSIDGPLLSWRDEIVGGTRGQEQACILSLV